MKKKVRPSVNTSAPLKPFTPLVHHEYKDATEEEYQDNRIRAYLPLGFIRVESDHATHFYHNHKHDPVYCFIQLYDSTAQSFVVTNQYGVDVMVHCTCLHACLTPRKFINPKKQTEDEKVS